MLKSIINAVITLLTDTITVIIKGLWQGIRLFVPSLIGIVGMVAAAVAAAAYSKSQGNNPNQDEALAVMAFIAVWTIEIWRNVWKDMFPKQ